LDKAPDAFRTISEVAEDLDIPQHVLRFWESRFPQIKPMKRAGGRRYYRPDDVDLLRGIRHLLYGEGYTIKGVQRILKEDGLRFVQSVWQPGSAQPEAAPEGEAGDSDSDRLPPDEAARSMFGLLRARAQPGAETDEEGLDEAAQGRVAAAAPGLSRDNVDTLQNVLQELMACRRLLDDAVVDGTR
jgi:DNA-binding transcriptional MerR regulator